MSIVFWPKAKSSMVGSKPSKFQLKNKRKAFGMKPMPFGFSPRVFFLGRGAVREKEHEENFLDKGKSERFFERMFSPSKKKRFP